MPAYGVKQSGPNTDSSKNLTSLQPGDPGLTLWDGTETPLSGNASVAFSRGPSVGGGDNGTSFDFTGMDAASVVDVQVSNLDVAADYITVSGGLTPDANGNAAYTDIGRSAFYRVVLTTYVSGAMPKCVAKR